MYIVSWLGKQTINLIWDSSRASEWERIPFFFDFFEIRTAFRENRVN